MATCAPTARAAASATVWTDRCEAIATEAVRRYFAPGMERDDLLQEARFGVFKATRDWRSDAGMPFEPFARLCAKRQLVSAVVAARRLKHAPLSDAVSLDAPFGAPDTTLTDFLAAADADPCARVLQREELAELISALDHLTDWERECIARTAAGEPYAQIGAEKRVDNALQRARRKLALATCA